MIAYLLFSAFIGYVAGTVERSWVAGIMTAIFWPIGLGISIYQIIREGVRRFFL